MTSSRAGRALRAGLLLCGLLLLSGAGLIAAALLYPRASAERIASHLLQREVQLAALGIDWGETITIRLRGLRLADRSGKDPMLAIAVLEAAIDRAALFEGRLVYRRLTLERPLLVLQRDADGRGNWAFGNADSKTNTPAAPGGLALIPQGRTQFPDLLDVHLSGGAVRYRTSSGRWLTVRLDELRIHSDSATAPARLRIDGAYNGIPASLTADTASFDNLRDAARPFDTALSIASPDLRLEFRGVLTDPLDVDGAEGRLSLEAERLGALLAVFGVTSGSDLPLRLAGGFSRLGAHWRLEDVRGAIAGSGFTGRLHLQEGPRGGSDALDLDIDSPDLDLAPLLAGAGGDTALQPDTAADAAWVDLTLAVARLRHGQTQILQDLALQATGRPGSLVLRESSARLGGGRLSVSGAVQAMAGQTARLELRADLRDARAERLAMLAMAAPADAAPISGRVDATLELALSGATLQPALQRGDGRLVIAMREGRVARRLVEAASADLRALLRQSGDATALHCLLGVASLQRGSGSIGPLRLRSGEGNVDAGGSFDLMRRSLDLLIRSDPATTGFLALDIPLRLHGPLDNLAAAPARDAPPPSQIAPARLPDFARDNPCRPRD